MEEEYTSFWKRKKTNLYLLMAFSRLDLFSVYLSVLYVATKTPQFVEEWRLKSKTKLAMEGGRFQWAPLAA